MNKEDKSLDIFAPETILITTADDPSEKHSINNDNEGEQNLGNSQADLISMETLRSSPVEFPLRLPGMDDFLTMSDTPIHRPNDEYLANMTPENIAKINKLATMEPEELIAKIKSMHDEIYQLGIRESREMSRGKLLGIFDLIQNRKQ